jgi:hypothetical protein
MKKAYGVFFLMLLAFAAKAQADKVSVLKSTDGMKLTVNGEDFMVNGMNWDYFPIGTNFSYSLWNQSDDIIRAALDAEMSLLKNMGVNTIRSILVFSPDGLSISTTITASTQCSITHLAATG